MKKKKIFYTLFATSLLALSLTSCGDDIKSDNNDNVSEKTEEVTKENEEKDKEPIKEEPKSEEPANKEEPVVTYNLEEL